MPMPEPATALPLPLDLAAARFCPGLTEGVEFTGVNPAGLIPRSRLVVGRRRWRTSLVVAVALVMLAVAAATADATFPGRTGVIAWSYSYQFNEGPTPGGFGILTVPSRGGRDHTVRSCSTFGYCEAWNHVSYSPNGKKLAWEIHARRGASHVIVAEADGTLAVDVGRGFGASFSPSGRRLVFVRSSGAHEQIVTSDLRGRVVRTLHSVKGAADPQFSPNGRQILFASDKSVWIMDATGRNAHAIIANAKAPSWAPSGKEIAYVNFKSGRVFTALPDGARARELPADGLCYPPACGGGSNLAVFSPDGRTIAFDDIDGSGDPNVYTMPAAGGRAKNIDSFSTDDAGGVVTGLTWQSLR
jgi:Tol biopolymer transport system component